MRLSAMRPERVSMTSVIVTVCGASIGLPAADEPRYLQKNEPLRRPGNTKQNCERSE